MNDRKFKSMINTQKGMTLIELMITMAILSVIILGLVVFLPVGLDHGLPDNIN